MDKRLPELEAHIVRILCDVLVVHSAAFKDIKYIEDQNPSLIMVDESGVAVVSIEIIAQDLTIEKSVENGN